MRRIHASTHTSHTERHSAGAQCRTQPHLPFLSITTVSFLSFLSRITHRFYRVTEIPTQTAHPRLERPTRRSLALPLSLALSLCAVEGEPPMHAHTPRIGIRMRA